MCKCFYFTAEGPREKLKAKLPKNGPGLWFNPRDWSSDAPAVCGDWVRIFPFDAITDECAKFETDEDMKKSVTQVRREHLHIVLNMFKDGFCEKKEFQSIYFHPETNSFLSCVGKRVPEICERYITSLRLPVRR